MVRGQLAVRLAVVVSLVCAPRWCHLVAGERRLRGAPKGHFRRTTAYGCPKHPVFEDPWVKENIAVTYGLQLRDGLGSQTYRMLAVYAIAAAMGMPYVHTPFQCIGHIGGHPHYRNMHCGDLPPADQQYLKRISQHISLPSTTSTDTSSWDSVIFFKGDWASLANAVATALAARRPTVIRIELVDAFLSVCPDIFHHVGAWRPRNISATAHQASQLLQQQEHQTLRLQQQQQTPGGISSASGASWLLTAARSCRIAVHMRRGDVGASTAKRELPVTYYISLVRNIIKILESYNQDYSVEWFTEAARTPREHDDMVLIRAEVPNLTLLHESDLLWTWQQMWTSDIFVMSKSGYSFVPAIVNVQAINIHAPAVGSQKSYCKFACKPSHWFESEDESGMLSTRLTEELHRRASGGFRRQQ